MKKIYYLLVQLLSLTSFLTAAQAPLSDSFWPSKDQFPKPYLKAQVGSVIVGDFASYSAYSNLRIDHLGSEALFGLGLGLYLNPHWSVEVNARQRTGMRYQRFNESVETLDFTIGFLDSRTATMGLFYHLGKLERATPYIGGGLGWGYNTLRKCESMDYIDLGLTTSMGKAHRSNLVYFLGFGLTIDLISHLKLDINYNFAHLGKAASARNSVGERALLENIRAHEVSTGLVLEF